MQSTPTPAQSQEQIDGRAREFIDALHALEGGSDADANALAALYAENAMLCNAALDNQGREIKGTDAILRFWVEYKATLGEVKSHFHHVTTSQSCAGLFWTTKGTNPAGDSVNYHGATLLQFDETGKIEFFRGYYDTRELMMRADSE